MTQTKKDWMLALGYIGFIYATLGVVGVPIGFLRAHGVLRLTLYSTCFILFVILLTNLIQRHQTQFIRLLGFFAIIFAAILVGQKVSSPEEQIHFLEYGLVGVLFSRALGHHVQSKLKNFIFSLLLSSLAGWFDEVLQGIIPNRHYDVRDIGINAISSLLGLLLLATISTKSTKDSF